MTTSPEAVSQVTACGVLVYESFLIFISFRAVCAIVQTAFLHIKMKEVSRLIYAAVIGKQNNLRKEKHIFDTIFRYLRRHRRFSLRP